MPSSITTFTLLFIILTVSATAATTVDEACKAAATSNDYFVEYGFCAAALRSNPASEKANDHDLALIAVQLCSNNVTGTKSKILRLIEKGNCTQYVKTGLQICFDNVYTPFTQLVTEAVHSFGRGNYTDSTQKIGLIREHYNGCDIVFNGRREEDPLLKDYDILLGLTTLASFLISRLM